MPVANLDSLHPIIKITVNNPIKTHVTATAIPTNKVVDKVIFSPSKTNSPKK